MKYKKKFSLSIIRTSLFILWVVACMSGSISAQIPSTDVATLQPGKTIERNMSGGQTHTYTIRVESGQFLHLSADQDGIDVSVNLLKPGGQDWIAINGPNGRYGPEEIAAIAETSGDYRVEVRATNKVAPAGRYKITLLGLREPTSADRERAAAESEWIEAYMKLRPQRTAATRVLALEKFQQALDYFKTVGNEYRQAWIMYVIGLLQAESGEFRKAFDYANQTLPLFRSVKDLLGEASTLNLLGGMSDVLGDPPGALAFYEQALGPVRASKNNTTEASVLNNIGKIYNDLADWQRSVEYYNQALTLFRANANQRQEAITLHNIGVAYVALGESGTALDMLQHSLVLRRVVKDNAGEADTLTTIGYVYNTLGKSDEALEYYNQAMPLRATVGDKRGEGVTLDQVGIAYASLGQPAKALEYHQQALERHRAAGSPRTEAVALGNIGHVYDLMGDAQKSLQFYTDALSIFQGIGDKQNEAKMLEGIAGAERKSGKLGDARQHLEQALSLIEGVRSTAGAQQSRASYFASRHGAYELYIDLLMQSHRENPAAGFDERALQSSERARARSLVELLGESRVDIRQGVDPALVTRENDLGQKINAKATRQIQLRAQKGSKVEIDTLQREISSLEIEYQEVQTAIRGASPAYAGLTQPKPLSLQEIQKQLDAETLLLEYALGKDRSYLWTISKDTVTSYDLPKGEVIEKSARQVYEMLTARNTKKGGETALQRKTRIIDAEAKLPAAAQALSQTLLAPAAAQFGSKRLVIVADGALQYIPFAMLPDPVVGARSSVAKNFGQPLIVGHEVVTLPSASALAIQRTELAGRQPAPKMLAVIADPVFDRTDVRFKTPAPEASDKTTQPQTVALADTRGLEHIAEASDDKAGRLVIRRLPFTRQEADQLMALTPKTSSFRAMDFQASRANVLNGDLAQYRYVHFATHGLLDTERPGLSSLVLSTIDAEGKPQNGFLRTNDIYNMKLPAELVVLSACQTGLGKEVKGEGLIGLTRGFMYAGAKRVVVSLWSVNDKATSELMTKFYRGMLKNNERPAAALRAAQIEMWKQKQWQSPYYWAAFTMQGEWK